MIGIILIFLSVLFLVLGKIPIWGGKILIGKKARYIGFILLILSCGLIAGPRQISLPLMIVIIFFMSKIYFFTKSNSLVDDKKKGYLFTSIEEEKSTYLNVAIGLTIALVVMGILGELTQILIQIIRNMG